MKNAIFRFYEELNDFLPKSKRKVDFEYAFAGRPTVKNVIEMIGVPHSEVDLILVNGDSVPFDYRLQEGDRVAVYPVFETIDIAAINHLRPRPLRTIKFILDVHLGRLTKYLRICGFDCYYEDLDDLEIVRLALKDKRIILTKDKGLLKNKEVTHGYWVRATNPQEQLLEIFTRFDLRNKIKFLVRCLICNSKLIKISKQQLGKKVPPITSEFYDDFFLCRHCNKIYWKGSHYENMSLLIEFIENAYRKNDPNKKTEY